MVFPIGPQNPVAVAFGVVILTGFQMKAASTSPPRNRDTGIRMASISILCPYFSRSAFSVTVSDEVDMARAAISGVARPTNATGTATRL